MVKNLVGRNSCDWCGKPAETNKKSVYYSSIYKQNIAIRLCDSCMDKCKNDVNIYTLKEGGK